MYIYSVIPDEMLVDLNYTYGNLTVLAILKRRARSETNARRSRRVRHTDKHKTGIREKVSFEYSMEE